MSKLLAELNRDIWHPFARTYAARDLAGFLAIYAADLIRAGGPGKSVHGYEEYRARMADWFTRLRDDGAQVSIEFRFTERLAAGGLASERGIFKIEARRPPAAQRVIFGRFHTFARKAGGRWRIVADYDSDESGSLTRDLFQAAAHVDNILAFAGSPDGSAGVDPSHGGAGAGTGAGAGGASGTLRGTGEPACTRPAG